MDTWLVYGSTVAAAMGTLAAYGGVYPRAQIFGPTICRTNSPFKLAITFDDGPNPAITPKLLDLLARYDARATFFVIGKFARECPELVREVAARGHIVGNHTEDHPNLFFCSRRKIREELLHCSDVIANLLGAAPKWFRPPYGFKNPWVIPAAASFGMTTAMWTVIPGDWHAPSSAWLIPRMQRIARRAELYSPLRGKIERKAPGHILCLHDGDHRHLNGDRTSTLGALEYCLPRWRDLGLEFVTIEDAVSTPAK